MMITFSESTNYLWQFYKTYSYLQTMIIKNHRQYDIFPQVVGGMEQQTRIYIVKPAVKPC